MSGGGAATGSACDQEMVGAGRILLGESAGGGKGIRVLDVRVGRGVDPSGQLESTPVWNNIT